jgi:mycothiol synthase
MTSWPGGSWILDRAVAAAAWWNPRLLKRDTVKMCWDVDRQYRALETHPPYAVRPVDEVNAPADWLATMTAAGMPVTPWTWSHEFAERPGSRVIAAFDAKDRIVAAAGIRPVASHPLAAHLMWVGTHPDHQGRSLGRIVVTATMAYAAAQQLQTVMLLTDDERLAAIRLYLSLGFRPCLNSWDRTQHLRWARIARALHVRLDFCRRPEHRPIVAHLSV